MQLCSFPIVSQLNACRQSHFSAYHKSLIKRSVVPNFMAHKAFTCICIPANLLALGIGAFATVTSAVVLGSVKVAIFVFSLGRFRPTFSTGFYWLAERTVGSGYELITIGRELLNDVESGVKIAYKSARLLAKKTKADELEQKIYIRARKAGDWTAKKLSLNKILPAVVNTASQVFNIIISGLSFALTRLFDGLEKTVEVERRYSGQNAPFIMKKFDSLSKGFTKVIEKYEYNAGQSRSFSYIAKHALISVPHVAFNAVAAACSAVALCVLFPLFLAKVVLSGATTLNIPIPTFVGYASTTGAKACVNVGIDLIEDLIDGFSTVAKIGRALKLQKIAFAAWEVATYVPKAVFS